MNVVQIAYDQYQLHDLMTRIQMAAITWTRQFSQGTDRLIADKRLYDLIVQARIHTPPLPDLRQHIQNAAAQQSPKEDTKLRIVKKSEAQKIDLAVALSMASFECLRLNLNDAAYGAGSGAPGLPEGVVPPA
jgi:phage terminase large subunit-like protein